MCGIGYTQLESGAFDQHFEKWQAFPVLCGNTAAQASQDTSHGRGGLGENLEGGIGTEGRNALQTVGESVQNKCGMNAAYSEASVDGTQAGNYERQS